MVIVVAAVMTVIVHWRRPMRGNVVSAFDSEIRIVGLLVYKHKAIIRATTTTTSSAFVDFI